MRARKIGRELICLGAVLWAWRLWAQEPSPAGPAALRLTLTEAIQRALQQHPDVRSAQEAIRRAQAQARIVQAQRWPQITAQAAWGESKTLQMAEGRSTDSASLALNFEIFSSTREAQIKRAELQAQAQRYGLPDMQRQLTYEVKRAYYEVLANRQLAQALMRAVAAAERHRELVEARIQAGTAPEADLLPVLVEVAQARLQATQAETSLETAQARLRALLALPAGVALELDPTLPETSYQGDLSRLLAEAREKRPDIKQQELNVQAAHLATVVARAEAGVRWQALATADWGHHTDETGAAWQIQIGASYSLFDAGAARAQITAAQASEEIERQRLAALLLQMQQEVEAAHWQAQQAAAALEAATIARRNAENSLAAAEARYAAGLAIILEVTDAQVQLLRAQVAEVQARLDYAAALAAVDLAVGAPPM